MKQFYYCVCTNVCDILIHTHLKLIKEKNLPLEHKSHTRKNDSSPHAWIFSVACVFVHTYMYKIHNCKHVSETSYNVFIVTCMLTYEENIYQCIVLWVLKYKYYPCQKLSNVTISMRFHYIHCCGEIPPCCTCIWIQKISPHSSVLSCSQLTTKTLLIITTKIFKNSCWLLKSNQWTGLF